MGRCDAKAPGYFAYERWMLGWLDDSQIYCHDNGEAVVEVKAIETRGGTKAIIVPLDSTSALVIESRRKIGFDQELEKDGVLVYLINTALQSGNGPIQLKPGADNGNELMEDAPMKEGDTYTFQNISVEVLESRGNSDRIRVKVNKISAAE